MEFIVENNAASIIEDVPLFKSSQNSSHPKKFLKLLRREELLYERRLQLGATPAALAPSTVSNSLVERDVVWDTESEGRSDLSRSPSDGVSCTFRGLLLSVPLQGLRPRESSGVIVDAALSIIRSEVSAGRRGEGKGPPKRELRILDIGCGSGALLLSLIYGSRNSMGNILGLKNSHLDLRISGCGIDIDDLALKYAKGNYDKIFGGQARGGHSDSWNIQEDVQWHNADFTKLPTDHDRLCSDGNTWGDFQLIVCNPPFLSQKAGSRRATEEPNWRQVWVGIL
jgi:hypothetical protein